MSDTCPPPLTVAPDGFLWFSGHKLPARLVPGGIEMMEKEPRRVVNGNPRYVIPFVAFMRLFAGCAGVAFNTTVIEVMVEDQPLSVGGNQE